MVKNTNLTTFKFWRDGFSSCVYPCISFIHLCLFQAHEDEYKYHHTPSGQGAVDRWDEDNFGRQELQKIIADEKVHFCFWENIRYMNYIKESKLTKYNLLNFIIKFSSRFTKLSRRCLHVTDQIRLVWLNNFFLQIKRSKATHERRAERLETKKSWSQKPSLAGPTCPPISFVFTLC